MLLATAGFWEFLSDVWLQIICKFFEWLWNVANNSLNNLMGWLNTHVPASWQPSLGIVIPYIRTIDTWIPINFIFSLLVAGCVIWVFVIVVKWIVEFIPGM